MSKQDLQAQKNAVVIINCRQEALRLIEEVGHCFELFRRALAEGNEAAWGAIMQQYSGLVISWIQTFCSQPLTTADEDDLLQESFSNFWQTLHKMGKLFTHNFPHVGALLKYLYQCTRTAVIAQQRKSIQQFKLQEQLKKEAATYQSFNQAEPLPPIDDAQRTAVKQWLQKRVSDPQEKLIIFLSYDLGLTPQQIVEQHPADFANAQAVYRIKERILKRMKRDLVS